VNWPVTVEVDGETIQADAMDLSPLGAKLARGQRALRPGSGAQLRFHPGGREPFDVQAIVWRTDPDGDAFFFTSSEEHLVSSRPSERQS
jgi:hypothetical protein